MRKAKKAAIGLFFCGAGVSFLLIFLAVMLYEQWQHGDRTYDIFWWVLALVLACIAGLCYSARDNYRTLMRERVDQDLGQLAEQIRRQSAEELEEAVRSECARCGPTRDD